MYKNATIEDEDFLVFHLASHGVAVLSDINLINKVASKKKIIEQARQWPNYFCRFFPISVGFSWFKRSLFDILFQMPKYHSGEVQMLGISHSGLRLIKRKQTKTTCDTLQVLESFSFDHIQQISPIRNGSSMDIRLTKKRITIHSHRVRFLPNLSGKKTLQF